MTSRFNKKLGKQYLAIKLIEMTKRGEKPNQSLKIPKIILVVGRLLSLISTKWTVLFAARLFTSPIKHKIPKREMEMDSKSRQETIFIPSIRKNIVVYHFGDSEKKILLVQELLKVKK